MVGFLNQPENYVVWSVWGLVVFGVIYSIFKLFSKQVNPLEKTSFWISWIIATPASYIAAVAIFIGIVSYSPSYDFSTEAWNNDKGKRTELIDDLVYSGRLDNLHQLQVIELLGEPLNDCGYFAFSERDMIYNLGQERGFLRIDDEWLLIWLKDSVVVRYEVKSD